LEESKTATSSQPEITSLL